MNTLSAGLAFWRELHHPVEKRGWRCRPTPLGVEVQFRDESDPDWSGRVLAFTPPPEAMAAPPQRLETHLGTFETCDVSPVHVYARRMEAAAREAVALVGEQLAEGFVDVSRDAGLQLWEMCEALWRFESKDSVLVERLVASVDGVSEATRLRVGRALVHRAAGPWTSTILDGGSPQIAWWPSTPTDDERDRALEALRVQPHEAVLLLFVQRMNTLLITEAALRALTHVAIDESLVFAVIHDLLLHPGLYYSLPHEALMALAPRVPPTAERVAALLAYGGDAPTATATRLSAAERHFQRGFQAFAILARWTHDETAAEALYQASSVTSSLCVVIAAETHPRRRWVGSLTRQRTRAPAHQHARYDAAIEACVRAADA